MIRKCCTGLIALLLSLPASATDLQQLVPDTLKPWSSWVLRDQPDLECPHLYNANEHFCAYPSTLHLTVQGTGGRFEQAWTVYRTSWIQLPGNNEHWPLEVRSNNKSLPVVNRNGQPAIELAAGQHSIQGRFSWQQAPKALQLPSGTGLVYVSLNGKAIEQPDIRDDRLWLTGSQAGAHETDRLSLSVFRRLSDSQPLRMTTLIQMDVAGKQREVQLNGALLQDFEVAGLHSRLPARIDQQGRLRLQLRPGHWQVSVDSLLNQPTTAIKLAGFAAPWPTQEIWALQHQPQLRQIQVQDRTSIDPQQTQLPADWKQLPAYALGAGETLQWTVIKRGNPEPEPDQLTLNKTLWLDFSGEAFTVQDQISGSLSRHWRLNVSPEVALGQVTIDGQPQTITRLEGSDSEGVELRQGTLDLSADSRVAYRDGQLSASGWQTPFDRVNASLNLPMGYQLFSLSGAHAPTAWLQRWTLLDLFLVLITAIACYRLWGIGWGLLALATLTLIWHEFEAPQLIWLNLIITIALIKVLSPGRLLTALNIYRKLVMLVLLLTSLVFVIVQARTAVYPQLERTTYAPPLAPMPSKAKREAEQAQPATAMVEEASRYSKSYADLASSAAPEKQTLMFDPDAMIQTGPGLPTWSWHRYPISWDGPVQQNQDIEMTLISPGLHRLLNLLRILLMVALLWRLFDIPSGGGRSWSAYLPGRATAGGLLGALLVPLLMLAPVSEAQADFPSKALLTDLQKHLSQPAECLPECAGIESLHVQLSPQQLTLTVTAHSADEVALPLPVPARGWVPSKVLVDQRAAHTLFRRPDQSLWLALQPGVHRLSISGSVAQLAELKIDFQLKPKNITYQLSGWSADISGEQLKQARSLGFQRLTTSETTAAAPLAASNDIPVFARVTRELELGLDWTVNTRVTLSDGNALPAILHIPLLPGESVITEGITVENNQAIVTLNQAGRSQQWRSTLPTTEQLTLTAAEGPFSEIWQLDASPIWHIDTRGIPVIYHQRQGDRWQPEWHPWPGEQVTLQVTRPAGVQGNTRTIDQSQLVLTPGESLTRAQLKFNLRSSLGGQHTLHIPADSELMSLSIDGTAIPARMSDGAITLPINPGSQNIELEWREPRGIHSGLFSSSSVNLGTESVNSKLSIKPGQQRWVLFAGGPKLGPAVLFWGVFLVILLVAVGLSRIKNMPLNLWHWLLLGIGLSASAPAAGLLIVGWLLALRARAQMKPIEHVGLFNGFQILLVALTALSLLTLFYVIQQGLLGSPDMQITGNQSSRYLLNWYTDRSPAELPTAWVISVPLVVYRILMLLWAIWLAFALLNWLRWGWDCYVTNGYWREWHWAHEKKQVKQDGGDEG
jgi:hypothetical protein